MNNKWAELGVKRARQRIVAIFAMRRTHGMAVWRSLRANGTRNPGQLFDGRQTTHYLVIALYAYMTTCLRHDFSIRKRLNGARDADGYFYTSVYDGSLDRWNVECELKNSVQSWPTFFNLPHLEFCVSAMGLSYICWSNGNREQICKKKKKCSQCSV